MMTGNIERISRFLGFRACPACGETLFAAEHGIFGGGDRITLHWRCDSCDHRFETGLVTIDSPPMAK
ncbi:hypothetical protein [Pseudorhodoplanes sp.]|uniref:hypothetical protein n=1 Tax=Pseudorhodoplanes sp. TaxID=1934341 RepID=UPI002B916A9B|nr:hypothetical protein [Pseudorhodoplanes sp.]HWV51714.1 hypothetical protein [Pseudorhodoplanes sp.]